MNATARLQEGMRLHQAGRLDQAEKIYREVLAQDQGNGDAWHLLGMAEGQRGRLDAAAENIGRAVERRPQEPLFRYNHGYALKQLGRLEDAQAAYAAALRLKPDYVEAYINRGGVLAELQRFDEAEACFTAALRLRPDHVNAQYNLATVYLGRGKYQAAADTAALIITLEPNFAEAHNVLGVAQMNMDQADEAFASFRAAVRLNRKNQEFWANWATCLKGRGLHFPAVDEALLADLLELLEKPSTPETDAVRSIWNALRKHGPVARALHAADADLLRTAAELSKVPLLLRILDVASIPGTDIEEMLIRLRRGLLDAASAGREIAGLPFFAGLAIQCFNCEYLFADSKEELAAVDTLQAKIEAAFAKSEPVTPAWIVAVGAYRPLYEMPWAREVLAQSWPAAVQQVVKRQIAEPFEEQAVRPTIRQATPVQDEFSQLMRSQYETYPYPRWSKPNLHFRPESISRVLRHLFPYVDWPEYRSPERPEILVAGCGTGRHALNVASQFANGQVLAVDLSLISLGYAVRKTRELGITNVEYAQADILELGRIGRTFDHVESVGVLHHLRDPLAGWRVLVPLLRDGGTMKIGLYSELARRGVVKSHELIRARGYETTLADIRRCRQEILAAAAAGDRDFALLMKGNIFTVSEVRDLLFDQREHQYTIPKLAAALDELGLEFLGFELPGQSALRRFQAQHPGREAPRSLELWDKFERANPDTFIGMYQFWLRKRR